MELFAECGFLKPPTKILLSEKADIVQSVALHHVILKTLGELSQFQEGLQTLGACRAMQLHGDYLQDFYVIKSCNLTAG